MKPPADATASLDAILIDRAAREPDRPLLVSAERPAPITAAELEDFARRAAGTLARFGIGPGDRLALWGQNSTAWAVWLCAAAWRGAAVVALHPALEAEDLADGLLRSGAHWLIADEIARGRPLGEMAEAVARDLTGKAGAFLRGVTVQPGGDGTVDPGTLLSGEDAVPAPLGQPDRPLNLQFTSGSTGRPKAVVLSQRALVLNARRTAQAAGIDGSDRIASPLPLYHAAGLSSGLVLSLATGALWCSSHRFEPRTSLGLIERHAATVFQGVPTMFKGLCDAVGERPGATGSLRLGFIGGAPCPPDLCRRSIRDLGLERMALVYGQTEFGPTISLTTGSEPDDLAFASVGPPIEGTEVRIVDPETEGDTATGEIWVRGDTLMNGYFGDDAATASAVTGDGWLRTGDLGHVDRGCLKVTGRLKELIIRGGENVSPTEVEAVLHEAPGVADAVVVPVPSAHWGEEICAVVLRSGTQPPVLDDISAFCAARLARYKRPDRYVLRDDLPTLPSGKVDRAAVRRAVAAGDW